MDSSVNLNGSRSATPVMAFAHGYLGIELAQTTEGSRLLTDPDAGLTSLQLDFFHRPRIIGCFPQPRERFDHNGNSTAELRRLNPAPKPAGYVPFRPLLGLYIPLLA